MLEVFTALQLPDSSTPPMHTSYQRSLSNNACSSGKLPIVPNRDDAPLLSFSKAQVLLSVSKTEVHCFKLPSVKVQVTFTVLFLSVQLTMPKPQV